MRALCGWVQSGVVGCLGAAHLLAEDAPTRTVDSIRDNSFLVEEAYNQEAGVVHHILLFRSEVNQITSPEEREWTFSFTQEWPLCTQTHQIAYTLPYSTLDSDAGSVSGLGDVSLSYRLQAVYEGVSRPAVAPRFSLVLPTGSARRGLGDGTVGYQFNLPVSKALADRWALHANLGVTTFPGLDGRDPVDANAGFSIVYAWNRQLHLLLETVGTWEEQPDRVGQIHRSFEAVLSPGVRYALNWGSNQLVLGLGIPIGLTHSTPNYGLLVYLSLEHPITATSRD